MIKALTEVEKAYIAGIVDGEGCISVRLNAKQGCIFNTTISVEMVGIIPLWLLNTTGIGHLYHRKRKEGNYVISMWVVGGKQAESLINSIKAYIVQKEEEVKQFMRFRETVGCNGKDIPIEIMKTRRDCANKLKAARYG